MRKLVLDKHNVKQIATLMQKMLNKPFVKHSGFNMRVVSVRLGEFTPGLKGPDLYYGNERMSASVTVKTEVNAFGGTAILVELSKYVTEMYFVGDVFYFYGGNVIRINKVSPVHNVSSMRRLLHGDKISFDIFVLKKDVDPRRVENLETVEKILYNSFIYNKNKSYNKHKSYNKMTLTIEKGVGQDA